MEDIQGEIGQTSGDAESSEDGMIVVHTLGARVEPVEGLGKVGRGIGLAEVVPEGRPLKKGKVQYLFFFAFNHCLYFFGGLLSPNSS